LRARGRERPTPVEKALEKEFQTIARRMASDADLDSLFPRGEEARERRGGESLRSWPASMGRSTFLESERKVAARSTGLAAAEALEKKNANQSGVTSTPRRFPRTADMTAVGTEPLAAVVSAMHMLTVVGRAERRSSPFTRGGGKSFGKTALESSRFARGMRRREVSWMGRLRGEEREPSSCCCGRPSDESRKMSGTPTAPVSREGRRGDALLNSEGRQYESSREPSMPSKKEFLDAKALDLEARAWVRGAGEAPPRRATAGGGGAPARERSSAGL
jgi:hypothetical protein